MIVKQTTLGQMSFPSGKSSYKKRLACNNQREGEEAPAVNIHFDEQRMPNTYMTVSPSTTLQNYGFNFKKSNELYFVLKEIDNRQD